MTTKTLLYLALCSKVYAPGVFKKIEGFVKGARSAGYDASAFIIEPGGIAKYLRFLSAMAFANEDVVVIRYVNRIGLMIFLTSLVLRLRKRYLIIDVPTPMQNHFREVAKKERKRLVDLVDLCLIPLQGPLPFWPAGEIIQYAEESWWYSLGVRSRTVKTGNGVDVESIPLRDASPVWPSGALVLVAVGTVAFWHGWDKVIKTMAVLRDDPDVTFDIRFKIVGDGPDLVNLKKLAEELNLTHQVEFMGMLYGKELHAEYNDAHFGVGSLGWYRLGVNEASPLKSREYLAAGLPFIYATDDPDFNDKLAVALKVRSQEKSDDLYELLRKMGNTKLPLAQECRAFAEENLDFSSKVQAILPVAGR